MTAATPQRRTRTPRAANNGGGPHGRTRGVREAVDVLTVDRLRRIAEQVDTYDPFERPGSVSEQHERFRRHAVATRYAADRIAELARLTDRDELAVAALLHDVGRLVLAELHSAFSDMGERNATPDERIRRERRELGIDHALVGGVLVRRWALSPNVAAAIEGHHSPKASGHAAAIRLADLVRRHDDAQTHLASLDAADMLVDSHVISQPSYRFPHDLVHQVTSWCSWCSKCPMTDHAGATLLRLAGVNEFQGFFFARPCPAAAIPAILAREQRWITEAITA
jgi:putative nucleotidyltransferase with HDIG domain